MKYPYDKSYRTLLWVKIVGQLVRAIALEKQTFNQVSDLGSRAALVCEAQTCRHETIIR